MAFGKDSEQLKKVPAFGGNYRQKAAAATRRPKRKSGGARRFGDEFKPSETTPDLVRLIPGEFKVPLVDEEGNVYEETLPWWQFVEHFHGPLSTSITCSAGPNRYSKLKRDPCHGCDMYWEDWELRKAAPRGQKGPNRVSMRDMFVYTVLDMGTFHKMESTDSDGNIRTNPKTDKPYYNWVKCTQTGCQGCALGKESKVGHVMPWPMGRNHFESLDTYAEYVGASCRTCCTRDSIKSLMWQCGNGECGELIVNMSTTNYQPDQIKEMTSEPFVCSLCQVKSYLIEVFECSTCKQTGNEAERATIFDVDLKVQRVRSKEAKGTQLIIPATSDPKPVDPQFEELVKSLPLDGQYSPTAPDRQAQRFKISAPTQPSGQAHTQPYGQV